MENKKGSGIFLGVVGVATLIVAIIGATFAYFSIAVNGGTEDVNVTAYEAFDVSVDVVKIHPTDEALNADERTVGDGIIPLKAALLSDALTNNCLDSRGYMVCVLYKATFTNNGTESVTFNVQTKTTSNVKGAGENAVPFADLTFQSLGGTEGNLTVSGTATKLPATAEAGAVSISGATHTATTGTSYHYFVVYLDDPVTDTDQSTQMGAQYTGQVIYTTVAGTDRLTGYFGA